MSSEGLPPLPDPLTLPALQSYIRGVVKARNFTGDLDKILILLVEEVGELAAELGRRVRSPARFDAENLAHELIDILLYLLDFANGFSLDVIAAWNREHPAGGGMPVENAAPGLTLNALAARAAAQEAPAEGPESPELLMLLLSEQVGDIARELRKHWKGRAEADDVGRGVVAALRCLFRLGACFGVDFEAALAEKERLNAQRRWAY